MGTSILMMVSNLLCLVFALEDTLSALQSVTGKKDPDTSQCKKLKQTILTLSALLDLLLSQVAMTASLSHTQIAHHLNY